MFEPGHDTGVAETEALAVVPEIVDVLRVDELAEAVLLDVVVPVIVLVLKVDTEVEELDEVDEAVDEDAEVTSFAPQIPPAVRDAPRVCLR